MLHLLVVLATLRIALGTVRMPEEFNVEKDFAEKEKWKKAQSHIKCDLCQILVGHTFDNVGVTSNEDDVYNHIEHICDAEGVYDGHALIEPQADAKPSDWRIAKASKEHKR